MPNTADFERYTRLAQKCRWLAKHVDERTATSLIELASEYEQKARANVDEKSEILSNPKSERS